MLSGLTAGQQSITEYTVGYVRIIANTTFNLINTEEAISKLTGNFIASIPLVIGYSYFADKQ